MGGQFFEVSGGETFDLTKFSIPGTAEWDDGWDCKYLKPASEYIRVLDTESLADVARYTYISREYIIDNVGELCDMENPDLSAYEWAIGWWKSPLVGSKPDYAGIIEDGDTDTEWKVNGALNFPNSTTFVGTFAKGQNRQIVSSGEVELQPFAFNTKGAIAPVFGSQLPVDIDLSDLAIPGTAEWDGGWDCQYLKPASEYIRVLDTESLADVARYTYISREYIIDNVGELCDMENPDLSAYEWAIGWWKSPLVGAKPDYAGIIEDGETDTEWKVSDKVTIPAGTGFVGTFAKGKERLVYFPGALSVPSKQ